MKIAKLPLMLLSLSAAWLCHAQYHTNTITTPGGVYAFSVDGSPATNATIELKAGVTNVLNIQTDGIHPVVVTTSPTVTAWFSGATPQDVNSQPIAVTTPASGFPATLYYMCYFHGFYGQIHLTAPGSPVPPPNTILMLQVGTNIVMTSTGTNTTWLLIPEYNSNLVSGTWAAVPGFTNTFASGTNTTVFNRLEPICGPNVFLRIRQQKN
jgi:hypothetical protein